MKMILPLLSLLLVAEYLCGQNAGIQLISRYDHNLPAGGLVEIVAPYDSASQRLFANLEKDKVTIIDISDPTSPDSVGLIDLTSFGSLALNVAVKNSLVAVAVQGVTKQDSGKVVLFDTDGLYISDIGVGAAPGMLTFTPDGQYIVVANEGVPSDDYLVDPEGSVSVINLQNGAVNPSVIHVSFADYNIGAPKENLFPSSIHVYGPSATRAQDLEPEFVAISGDGQKAYVCLQENNTVVIVDIPLAEIDTFIFLGYKDHSIPGNEFDPSDQDGGINIASWPVKGMYQPDGLCAFSAAGVDYFLTANEGAARKYSSFDEVTKVGNIVLDSFDFSNISNLQSSSSLGRLQVSSSFGDNEPDGKVDVLYAFGGRSFSIRNATTGVLVYDSGNDFEENLAIHAPSIFNSTGSVSSHDSRSDNKGPEPEDVVVGQVGNRFFAFIGLEQVGGFMVYDITNPLAPVFMAYEPSAANDVGPEASIFINAQQSPSGKPLLIVSNEESSTLAIYELATTIDVPKIESKMDLKAYPNPTKGEFTIDLGLSYETVEFSVSNICGQQILTGVTNNSKFITINLEQKPGLYFVSLTSDSHSGLIKIMVE